MIPLFRRQPKPTIAALYGAIVAQARTPRFYADYAVPDTVTGRFDMIVLHAALLFRRMREGDEAARALAQGVFDAFCRDMDANLREIGISDQGVPREMRKVGEAFYGRAQAYDAALSAQGDGALTDALLRNVYAGAAAEVAADVAAAELAAYVRETAHALSEQPLDGLVAGVVRFPEPAPLAVPEDIS
jgi:cytochrome b pre-mRNA-processing protein 3